MTMFTLAQKCQKFHFYLFIQVICFVLLPKAIHEDEKILFLSLFLSHFFPNIFPTGAICVANKISFLKLYYDKKIRTIFILK